MKKLLFATIIGLVAGSLLAAGITNAPNWALFWSYPGPNSNIVFRAYGGITVAQATNLQATWPTWGTNGATGQYSNALYIASSSSFFLTLTASNSLGGPESPPSVAVSIPAPAQTPQSVSLQYIGQ